MGSVTASEVGPGAGAGAGGRRGWADGEERGGVGRRSKDGSDVSFQSRPPDTSA